jgi:hypothetical protein
LAPNTSSSHEACSPALEALPSGVTKSCRPRVTFALALTAGSSAAPLATRAARACAMRDWALAKVGLTPSALAISWLSSGSSNCCHHCARFVSVPWCGSGACHWAGASAPGLSGEGGRLAQPANAAASNSAGAVKRDRLVIVRSSSRAF